MGPLAKAYGKIKIGGKNKYMNTCLVNTLTGGSRRSAAVENARREYIKRCKGLLRIREDKIRNLAQIANGVRPEYQNG